MWAYLFFLFCCLIQPICLPVPEITTILAGTVAFGPHVAFVTGVVGIMIGITFMYYITYYLSHKYLEKVMKSKYFVAYKRYVSSNPFLTTGILLVIPVIPDEIICIGAALGDIKFKIFIILAFIAKIISVGMVAYSDIIGDTLGLSQFTIIIIEIGIMLLAAFIYKLLNKEKSIA